MYIKREAAEGEAYAELSIFSGDTIARLAKRACTEFGWGVATQMRLYLVPHVGKENPTAKAETLAKVLDKPAYSLADEGIASGSWLLARVSGPATADGASCVDVGVVGVGWGGGRGWGNGAHSHVRLRLLQVGLARAPSHRRPRAPSPLSFSFAQALLEWRRVRRRVHPSRRSPLR